MGTAAPVDDSSTKIWRVLGMEMETCEQGGGGVRL
jgi:hypothetical protein